MPTTYFVALPFVEADDGLAPAESVQCQSRAGAIAKAQDLARKEPYVGAVAFSRTGEPELGDFEEAEIIKAIGNVPTDFQAT